MLRGTLPPQPPRGFLLSLRRVGLESATGFPSGIVPPQQGDLGCEEEECIGS